MNRLKIPILNKAMEILKKYDSEPKIGTATLLPVFSNQKSNKYLKEITSLLNIKKQLIFSSTGIGSPHAINVKLMDSLAKRILQPYNWQNFPFLRAWNIIKILGCGNFLLRINRKQNLRYV